MKTQFIRSKDLKVVMLAAPWTTICHPYKDGYQVFLTEDDFHVWMATK